MNQISRTGKLAEDGRLEIPEDQRDLLGLKPGMPVVLQAENGVLTVRAADQVLHSLQDQVLHSLGVSDGHEVDRFIAERRAEAALENQWSSGKIA